MVEVHQKFLGNIKMQQGKANKSLTDEQKALMTLIKSNENQFVQLLNTIKQMLPVADLFWLEESFKHLRYAATFAVNAVAVPVPFPFKVESKESETKATDEVKADVLQPTNDPSTNEGSDQEVPSH